MRTDWIGAALVIGAIGAGFLDATNWTTAEVRAAAALIGLSVGVGIALILTYRPRRVSPLPPIQP